MEGRWAKLTLCAHLNKYIDITKYIHPVAEELVFRYILVSEEMKFYTASPMLDSEGELLYNKADWLISQRDCILPKDHIDETPSDSNITNSQSTMIDQWKLLNKKDNNG